MGDIITTVCISYYEYVDLNILQVIYVFTKINKNKNK